MKKNKLITAALFISVTFIWGSIIVKIYKSLAASNTIKLTSNISNKKKQKETLLSSYMLHTYIRDPFLSIIDDTATEIVPDTPVRNFVSKPRVSAPLLLPEYCGIITFGKTKTAIIKWNNRYEHVQEGIVIDSIKIKSVNDEKIIVQVKGVTHTILFTGNSKKENKSSGEGI